MKFAINDLIKEITLCITGHRPMKLPWHYDETKESCIAFKNDLKNRLEIAIQNGWKYFLSGMALGIDMIFAEIVLELQKKYQDIKLIAVIPCSNQDERWQSEQQKRYRKLLKQSDLIITISKEYTPTCMNDRNKFMVEHSSACIAVWNGSPSGTGNTVKYAKEVGCKVRVINPNNY